MPSRAAAFLALPCAWSGRLQERSPRSFEVLQALIIFRVVDIQKQNIIVPWQVFHAMAVKDRAATDVTGQLQQIGECPFIEQDRIGSFFFEDQWRDDR